ncbi:MAG: zeta toxin family protein [Oscillospiraceae bacterium]
MSKTKTTVAPRMTLNPSARGLTSASPVVGANKKFNSFEDFSNYEKMNRSAQDWLEVGETLANQRRNFLTNSYKSQDEILAHSSRFNTLNEHFLELADKYRNQYKDGSEARKTIDSLTSHMSSLRDAEQEYTGFMGQFKDRSDFNTRYAYPSKYKGSSAKTVEDRIAALSGQRTTSRDERDELNYLKQNRYAFYSEKELRQRQKELEKQIKQSQEEDDKLARQTGMFLGAESDKTQSLKSQLAAAQNALRDSVYAKQVSGWDEEHRDKFYNNYGAWLNKISREDQSSHVGMRDAVTGELDAARKGAAEMEKYLRSRGYTDEEMRGLRAYAQSQNNAQRAFENSEYWKKVADSGFLGKVVASAASIPANLMSGMAFVDSALQGLTNGEDAFTGQKQAMDYNASPLAYAGENMRSAVSANMGKVGQFFYDTGMSIADFLAAGGVMKATGAVGKTVNALGKAGRGVGNAAEVMLAGSAANSSMRSAKDRGASDAEALGVGFLAGLAEMAGEHMSIENLRVIENAMSKASSKRTVSNIFKSISMQAAVEGSEEGITTLANTLSDLVIMGDRSEYNLSVEQYIAEGDTQEEARRKAMRDWLEGLAQDVAGGALSGGVTSSVTIGGSLAHQKVQEAVVGWKDKESLHYLLTVDKALSYAEGTQTRQLAEDIAARLDGASTLADAKVSDSEIGKLIRLMAEEQPEVAESSTTNTRRDPASAFRPAQTQQTERTTAEPEQAQQTEPIELTQTAKAFEAQGIDTKSAIERGEILDTLLSGGAVSNSQLEKIGAFNDKAGQAAFAAITGVEVPTGLTASGLRKFYRATAAEYAQQQRLTVDAQEATAQAEANAQIDVQAELAEAMNPVSAFKPNVDNTGETGYNTTGRSAEVTGIIDRLNSKAATVEDAMSLPEIAAIEREAKAATPTIELPDRESIQEEAYRRAMEQGSFNGKDYTAPVRQEHRVDIVLGLPGSGKSSVYTERISQEHGSRVVDTDDYRSYIPEYNGRNAGVVHEEASAIKKRVLAQALENGDNIILSIIGDNAQKLEGEIEKFRRYGYSVHLHLNELPNNKAMARAIGRAFPEDGSQGRYVSPEIIAGYADKPTQTYLYLTGRSDINGIQTEHRASDAGGEGGSTGDVAQDIRVRGGRDQSGAGRSAGEERGAGEARLVDSYDWYNNDVDFGQPPILVESSEQSIAKGGAENAGTQSGVSPEGRTGTAAEGADSNGDTGARLDGNPDGARADRGVQEQGPVGRGNIGVHGVVHLSEVEKKIITDSGNAVVELKDFTSEPAVFSSALKAAREADTRNGWAVSPQDAESLAERNVTLLMSEDGGAGLGVTPGGDIIGVFKNPQSGGRGALYTLLPTALANGGVKLDCYGENLVSLYSRFGFIPVARVKFNAEYANPGWTADKGEPDIYFMIHNGDSADVALQKAINNGYTKYSQDYLDSLPEMDYEAAEKYRDEMIEMRGKAVELDDGSKLGFDEFAKQMREKLPDVTETELTEMFNELAESEAPLPVEETTVEGHTERTIAPEVIAEAADIQSNASHVKVDENVKLSRGQQWLAKFLASSLRETGVITDVEISGKYDADANGAIERGVLTLNPSKLKPGDVLQSIIGHELLHATVDKTKTDGKAKRDTKLVDSIIDALEQVNPTIDLNSRIAERTDAYKAFLSKTTNPVTGGPYTKTEVDLLVSHPYIREEIAADEVGKVFAEQHMLNDFAGLRPGLIARAYNTLGKIKNLRSNNSTEAKTMRRYAKETQQRITAALEMAGAYEVENGEATVRASVADKSWVKQTELGFIALGLRNVDGYTNADYAAAREELGESCFIMKSVPAVLQEIGLGQKPLTYTQTHFINATLPIEYGENGRANAHGISEDTITKLPELLSSPVMALETEYINKTTGKAEDAVIVIVDAYDSEGSPVGAVILPNGEAIVDGVRNQSNHILSVYGFESIEDQMRRAQAEGGFLYVNSSRADKMLRKIGQKKSAEPINSPDNASEEYSANEAVSDTASRIPQGMKDFSTRPDAQARQSRKPTPLQRVTSSSNSVAQNERLVNSRYKALAANPYLRGVEFDTVHPLSETTESAEQAARMLPESLMRSEYKRDGQLLRWSREGDVWAAGTPGKDTSYLNMSSPLIIDCGGADATQLGSVSGERGDSIKAIRDYVYANEMQYDGIVLRNLSIDGRVADTAITLTDAQVIPAEQSDTVTLNGTRFSVSEREYAPTFYSKLERVVESQKQDKLGAGSVVNMLRGKGVKAEEIKWSGIEAFLDGKKSVTKTELLDFLRENQLQIDTVQLGGKEPGKPIVEFYDEDGQVIRNPFWGQRVDVVDTQTGEVYATVEPNFAEGYMTNVDTGEAYWGESELRDALGVTTVTAEEDPEDGTHWSKYTLGGGENYRELLYTMPNSDYHNQAMEVHWNRDGVLAHARVQDFVNAEGKSVLFIEEIQSDWHNAGQKEGYNSPAETEAEYKRLQKRVLDVDAELDTDPELAEIVRKLAVLRGDNNPEYAKNFLASTSGHSTLFVEAVFSSAYPAARAQMYDSTIVANTDEETPQLTLEGQQQVLADADVVRAWQGRWTDANAELREYKWAMDRGLTPDAPFRNSYTDFVLKNLIRDAAEQGYDMIAWTTSVQQEARWSSEFAEGYRIEYDQDIPSFLKKYGKQWGAKVGYTLIGKDLTNSSAYRDGGMEAVMTIAANTADETGSLNSTMHVVHSMDITDAMRESVLYEGQPRFSVAKQSDTEQTDSAADDELFTFDNAVRFAVGGGRTIDDFVSEILRRREVSRVRSNTFQRSGIFTQAELAMPGLAAKDMEYSIADERSSIAEAERRLTENYEGAKSALVEKTGAWDSADLDTAMGVLSQEVENARQNNDYRTVIQWAQRIRARGTQAGQMVQAFAKYTRTPEGVLVRAAADLENSTLNETQRADLLGRIAQFSETLDAIQTGDKDALIELIRKQAKQRNTPVSEKTLEAMRADTTDFQFLYDTALTQLDQIAKDYVKTNLGRKVATFQTIAHLLNLKTTNRNLGSNNIFTLVDTVASDVAMLPDLLLSAITGQRTVGLDRSRFSKAARAGAKDARNRARVEIALDVAPDDTRDKYGTSRRTWKMTGGRAARGMSTLEKAMGFTLNYTDESAKGAIRAQVMQSLQPFVENGTLTTEEAQQFAEEEARYRTFQDDTLVSSGMRLLKQFLNTVGVGGARQLGSSEKLKTHDFGLGDIVVKYTQVPGALITRAMEFSPLGYAKALVNAYGMFQARHELSSRTDLSAEKKAELKTKQDLKQRRAALFMGRATTGSGLIAFFAALAAKGILSNGDDEDDPDAKALNAAMGINGTQLNMSALSRWISGGDTTWREGDVMASLDFLEPLNSAMAMGTLIAKSDEGVDLPNMVAGSVTTLGDAFANLSVMQTLRTIIDTSTYYTPDSGIGIKDETMDKWATVGLNVALSGATGFMPSPVRQLAQALDDKNRDAYSERGILPKTWAQIRNVTPGLRETLPEKQTNFGEPKPTENALLRAVNAFAMPGNISTYKPSSAADELASVYGETDEANIYPDRNAPYKVTKGQGRDKEEYKLTPEARAQYLRTRGQLSKELIDSTRSSAAYDRADEFEKADMLIKAKNYANYIAKREAFADMGVSYEGDPTYEGYKEMLDSGVNLFDFLSYGEAKNELEADVDENGDPISGTKKAKTIELIGSLNMDSDQKEALYFKAYPNERKDFEALGIDFDSYYTYSRTMCTLKGDKDSNGKTISGSKKEKVVNLIDSLNISSEAKTQLYLDNGYTSKSIPRWS